MDRCTKCLMPSTRPDTAHVDGVCSACVAYENRPEIDWESRGLALQTLLNDAPRNDSGYNCIVPSSGGKDSHFQVLTLLELGAKPLVVTAATCHLTSIGRRNIDNLARYADTVEITPNKTVRADLNRLSLEMVGDISLPEHFSIFTVPFRIAYQMGIPLVFYGENPLNSWGSPDSDRQAEQRMTQDWVAQFAGFLGAAPRDFIGKSGISACDMTAYCGPSDAQMEAAGIGVYFLGQFVPWDSRKNGQLAKNHGMETMLPCRGNWWDFENLDNGSTGIHDYFGFLKYGYGRACVQLSFDVRSGVMSREDALVELELRDGLFPESYAGVDLDDVLDSMGMPFRDFKALCEKYTA